MSSIASLVLRCLIYILQYSSCSLEADMNSELLLFPTVINSVMGSSVNNNFLTVVSCQVRGGVLAVMRDAMRDAQAHGELTRDQAFHLVGAAFLPGRGT